MDRLKAYKDLFSDYEKQIRPLISRIEVLEEKDPEDLYQKVALMFTSFAQTANENRLEDEEWIKNHYEEALWFRGDLLVLCYRCLINEIDEKTSRLMKGLKKRHYLQLPSGFKHDFDEAKSDASNVKKKFEAYRRASGELESYDSQTIGDIQSDYMSKKRALYKLTEELVELHRELYSKYEKVDKYYKDDPKLETRLIDLKLDHKSQIWLYQVLPVLLTIVMALISYFYLSK